MNLTSPSQVKAWCIEHDFHPNKTLGQNFLIDRNVLEAIVDAGLDGVPEGAPILEIGPGLGVMTQELLRRGHDVVAIEKDPFLAEGLEGRVAPDEDEVAGAGRLTVVAADALDVVGAKTEASPVSEAHGSVASQAQPPETRDPKPEILVSNLPYQAGTRILLELVQTRRMAAMTVLLQTEVAERLAAKEGGRDRSLAGVWAQLDYDVTIVRKVGANCFWPRPEVGSSVARLVRHDRRAALGEDERKAFRRVTKQAFAHRRKQLGTIFKHVAPDAMRDLDDALMRRRPETLSVEDWIRLTKGLNNADT